MVNRFIPRYVRESGKSYTNAFIAHRRSQDRLQIAQRRIDDFVRHLFTAMKDKEKVEAEYAKTAHRLAKFHK